MQTVDELFLDFGRQLRRPENLPPCRDRTGELRKEMFDAAHSPAKVVEKHLTHDAPAQSRSPT